MNSRALLARQTLRCHIRHELERALEAGPLQTGDVANVAEGVLLAIATPALAATWRALGDGLANEPLGPPRLAEAVAAASARAAGSPPLFA